MVQMAKEVVVARDTYLHIGLRGLHVDYTWRNRCILHKGHVFCLLVGTKAAAAVAAVAAVSQRANERASR